MPHEFLSHTYFTGWPFSSCRYVESFPVIVVAPMSLLNNSGFDCSCMLIMPSLCFELLFEVMMVVGRFEIKSGGRLDRT